MSSDGTNIRVVISAESNKKLQAIQAHLMAHGTGSGKREALEYAIETTSLSLKRSSGTPKPEPKQRKR